ncbi:MAG: serine--tRNA ligase [Gemmatimonadaceae bacterium]|nr:serine--tRNA ligase [Gemmatimonadaceae bacterium]
MHDLRLVREQMHLLRDGFGRRGKLETLGPILDRLEGLEKERRSLITAAEDRKARRNLMTQEVAQRKRAGDDATELVAESRNLGGEIARLEADLTATELTMDGLMLELPNITREDVPAGDESHNRVVRTWGTPRADDGVRPHWDVAAELGIVDLTRGAKISGSGFIVYRGHGARLVRALINLMLDTHTGAHGYEETWVPLLVNRASMTGTGQLPKFEDDMYAVHGEDAFLIPTAEVPVTNLYRDEILDAAELPKALTAYSACFRKEAGAAGKDTRGLLRVHEFDKVELVRYVKPEESEAELEQLTSHAEAILTLLELPYRVLLLAAGDTGFASSKTYDLEVFAPGVGKWLEVSSCSNFGDFQARRMNIRFRPAAGEKPRFVHTLNGSGLALPRIIAALLEHGQQADGTIAIPAALRPYLGTAHLGTARQG